MERIRKLDDIDVAQVQTPSAKRARSLSIEQQHEQGRLPVHYESGSPPASSTTSGETCDSPRILTEAVGKDSDSEIKHQSASRHVSSGIQTSDSPANDHLPSLESHFPRGIAKHTFPDSYDVPSPQADHPSGIEGDPFPDSYDIPPSPVHVPSRIERAQLPSLYDTSSPPVHISKGLEGVHSPNSYNLPSSPPNLDFSSTLKESSPGMTPEQAQKEFEKQHHFYNDPDARYVVLISMCTLTPCPVSYSTQFWGCFETA